MHSVRNKIVLWHLTVAAGVGVVVAALAAWLFFSGISWNARQGLNAAALVVPDIVALYETRDGSLAKAAPAIADHFRQMGLVAFVLAGDLRDPAFLGGRAGAIGMHQPGGPPPPSLLDMVFMRGSPPERIAVPGGIVILGVDRSHYRTLAAWFGFAELIFFVLILGTAWFIAASTARHALEPLIRTTEALARFGDGHFTPEPVRTDDRSELGALARSYNRAVAEITRAFDERLQTEAEMHRFIADAGHQLRTPLTVIMGHLSAFSFRPNDPRSAAAFDNMLQESRRMRELIEDLIVLAKLEERGDTAEVTDVADIARRLVEGYALNPKTRRVRLLVAEDAVVAGGDAEIYGAIDALIDNALKYGRQTVVDVSLTRDGSDAVVAVADRGPGLPASDLENAFDRFYRGRTSEGIDGSGLGLSIVARTVRRIGGAVGLQNRLGGGLVAEIRLPRIDGAGLRSEGPRDPPSGSDR
jgi:signal transduction histidine kinase